MRSILIVGLGNLLMGDDGLGVHAVRALAADPSPDILVVDVGTAVLDALGLLGGAARVIAIDAIESGNSPGQIIALPVEDLDVPTTAASLHDLNIRSAWGMLRDAPPPEIVIIGIEPAELTPGMELSAPVRDAMPRLLAVVRRLAAGWSHDPCSAREAVERLSRATS